MALITSVLQSAAVSRTKQMSLQQPFKLSETITTYTGVDELAACSIDVMDQCVCVCVCR